MSAKMASTHKSARRQFETQLVEASETRYSRVLSRMEEERMSHFREVVNHEIELRLADSQFTLEQDLLRYDLITEQMKEEFRELILNSCRTEYDNLAVRPEVIPTDCGISYRSIFEPEEQTPEPEKQPSVDEEKEKDPLAFFAMLPLRQQARDCPLIKAIRQGRPQTALLELASSTNPGVDELDRNALHWAAKRGKYQLYQ